MLPLCPLPDVLPSPEPGPRPRRRRERCAPGAGARLSRPIFSSPALLSRDFSRAATLFVLPLLQRRHLDEVAHALDLSGERRRDVTHHHVLVVLETDRFERPAHAPRMPDAAADLLDANLSLLGKLELRRFSRPLPRVPD